VARIERRRSTNSPSFGIMLAFGYAQSVPHRIRSGACRQVVA
jgi:hypothetical protein